MKFVFRSHLVRKSYEGDKKRDRSLYRQTVGQTDRLRSKQAIEHRWRREELRETKEGHLTVFPASLGKKKTLLDIKTLSWPQLPPTILPRWQIRPKFGVQRPKRHIVQDVSETPLSSSISLGESTKGSGEEGKRRRSIRGDERKLNSSFSFRLFPLYFPYN